MAYCTNCGKELSAGARFCSVCGQENTEDKFDNFLKMGKYDIEIKPRIRLYGPRAAKSEIQVFVPQRNCSFRVVVPNTLELGQSVRLKGEGWPNPEGSIGDLLITPSEIEYYDVELTTAVSVHGAKNEISKLPLYLPHAKKTVNISVPNNIVPDKTLRIKGLGLDVPDGGSGDLYLHFSHIEYIDSESNTQTSNEGERKICYEGEIRKCPQCGDIINAFVAICPSCGYEIRGTSAASVVHDLATKLEQTDDPQKKDELIRTFYIPNTKEDIHEFFILALSNIKIGGRNTNAWMVKLEQAYQKAELSFNDTPEFDRLRSLHEKARGMNRRNAVISLIKDIGRYFKSGYAWALLFLIVGIGFFLIYSIVDNEAVGTVGFLAIAIAAWVAFFQHEDKKKK